MLRFSGSSQNPGSSVLVELQLSNALLGKETITIIGLLFNSLSLWAVYSVLIIHIYIYIYVYVYMCVRVCVAA